MTRSTLSWLAGDPSPEIRSAIERALAAGLTKATLLQKSVHRSVHRIELPSPRDATSSSATGGPALALKIHHGATGRHRTREALKRLAHRSPARLEWRAHTALFRAGVAVAAPRAWGRLANGDEILVSDFLIGPRPGEMRDPGVRSDDPSPQLTDAIADAVGTLHRAGFRHGDLHLGNLRLVEGRIHLLDLQRARPIRSPRDRLRDLAQFELSLARAGWTPAARMALRDRLGVEPEFDRILRRFLRDHLRGRARRVLRPGRDWARVRIGRRRGLRETALAESDLVAILATAQASEASEASEESADSEAAEAAPSESTSHTRRQGRVRIQTIESGGRTVVVKRFEVGLSRRALADLVRGAPAARAFRRGQAHRLLAQRTARPLAYLEEARFGLPIRSWLVMEKVGDFDLDAYRPASPELARRLAIQLGQWLADGHAWGLAHRDLKGSNLRIERTGDATRFWLIDLEDLSKGPVELSREARLGALGQLNASLPDEAFDAAARMTALEHYRARLPFSTDSAAALDGSDLRSLAAEIARRSLARGHHWRGWDCDCVAPSAGESARDGSPVAKPIRPGSP